MVQLLAKNWWVLEARGALTILFGLVALLLPGMGLGFLILAFAIYALAEGAVLLFAGFNRKQASYRWFTLLQGITGLAAGFTAVAWPRITAVSLLFVIAAWAVVTGILEIAGGLALRREPRAEWLLVLSGIISLFFAYMLLANPAVGALVLLSVIGTYAVVFGIIQVMLGSHTHRQLHGTAVHGEL